MAICAMIVGRAVFFVVPQAPKNRFMDYCILWNISRVAVVWCKTVRNPLAVLELKTWDKWKDLLDGVLASTQRTKIFLKNWSLLKSFHKRTLKKLVPQPNVRES